MRNGMIFIFLFPVGRGETGILLELPKEAGKAVIAALFCNLRKIICVSDQEMAGLLYTVMLDIIKRA